MLCQWSFQQNGLYSRVSIILSNCACYSKTQIMQNTLTIHCMYVCVCVCTCVCVYVCVCVCVCVYTCMHVYPSNTTYTQLYTTHSYIHQPVWCDIRRTVLPFTRLCTLKLQSQCPALTSKLLQADDTNRLSVMGTLELNGAPRNCHWDLNNKKTDNK